MAQGGRQDHRRFGRAARVQRLPGEHWLHLRTTNPIEFTFATVRLRTWVTKGPGSCAAGIAMALKFIQTAQARWRAVNAPHLVPLVRAGTTCHNGKLIERPDKSTTYGQASLRHADPQALTIPLPFGHANI